MGVTLVKGSEGIVTEFVFPKKREVGGVANAIQHGNGNWRLSDDGCWEGSVREVVDFQGDLTKRGSLWRGLKGSAYHIPFQGKRPIKERVIADVTAIVNVVGKQTRLIRRVVVIAGFQFGALVSIVTDKVFVVVHPAIPTAFHDDVRVFARAVIASSADIKIASLEVCASREYTRPIIEVFARPTPFIFELRQVDAIGVEIKIACCRVRASVEKCQCIVIQAIHHDIPDMSRHGWH